MSGRPTGITVQSLTRRIALSTRLPKEGAWIMLLVPDGSTDREVLSLAAETLPAAAVAELAEVIELQALGLRQREP